MLILLDNYLLSLEVGLRFGIYALTILIIAIAAFKFKQLTFSGAIGAFIMGFLALWCGGFVALSLYLFFLISAAMIGKMSKRVRGIDKIQAKGSTRDIYQVFANGGLALLSLIIGYYTKNEIFQLLFCAALAEGTADTWAGDIGVLSDETPVSIIDFKPLPKGLSGAVTLLGTLAGLLASVLYAIFYRSFYSSSLSLSLIVASTAFVGCLIDSVLGITVQAHYIDEN